MNASRGVRLAAAVAGLLALSACAAPTPAPSPPAPQTSSPAATGAADPVTDVSLLLAALETDYAARVGVVAIDTADGRTVSYRESERFAYASTLKAFAAAQLLQTTSAAERAERVTWTLADAEAAGYSPVTTAAVGTGMTVAELAEAAVRQSDNLAMNLVLEKIGGPAGLGDALALLGDTESRVVDIEPALNDVEEGATDDTTTPRAFAGDLVALLGPDGLDDADRATWLGWMSGNPTGDALVRSVAPEGWTVADKSGGAGPIRNDVAVVTPPGRAPVVLVVLTVRNDRSAPYDDELVARAARLALGALD